MSVIAITELKPGMVIVQITEQNGPVRIRKSGLVTSDEMVIGLQEMGVLQVEVDPSQTVEIDSPQTVTSSVQGMLLQSAGSQGQDKAISDQFNRSLFLPSVSGIPSMWQYYGKRVALVVLMTFAGLTVGWSTANVESWIKQSHSEDAKAASDKTEQDKRQTNTQSASQTAEHVDTGNQQSVPVSVNQPAPVNNAAVTDNSVKEHPSQTAVVSSDDNISELPPKKTPQEPSQVSPELLKKFNQAVAEMGGNLNETTTEPVAPPVSAEAASVPRVDQVPQWVRDALPKMSFSAHMYASEQKDRWVTLNGVKLQEGDWINPNLQLVKITPQKVILNYKGQQFSLNALADW